MPADPTAGTPRTEHARQALDLLEAARAAGVLLSATEARSLSFEIRRVWQRRGVALRAEASGTGLDANLWSDVVKFIRWSAKVRDDSAENIAVADALLSRLSPVIGEDQPEPNTAICNEGWRKRLGMHHLHYNRPGFRCYNKECKNI